MPQVNLRPLVYQIYPLLGSGAFIHQMSGADIH